MQVNLIDESHVTIDGRLHISKGARGYTVQDDKAVHMEEPTYFDPHHYVNGNNGLTVYTSVNRAVGTVLKSLLHIGPYHSDNPHNMLKGTTYLIKNDYGRDAAYRISGAVAKAYREGLLAGVPSGLVYRLVCEGEIQIPAAGDNVSLSDKRRNVL